LLCSPSASIQQRRIPTATVNRLYFLKNVFGLSFISCAIREYRGRCCCCATDDDDSLWNFRWNISRPFHDSCVAACIINLSR
jgi:hypothetical protein